MAEAPATADLNLTQDWTVEFWFRDDDPAGFDHPFCYIVNKGDTQAAESPYYVLIGNGSLLVGLRTNGTNYPLTYNLHPAGYSAKIWQHLATAPAGLVANWHFDGDCTSVVTDLLSSHTLTLGGPAAWSADVPGAPDPKNSAPRTRCG